VNLIRAENLKKEDIFGESDPYATLQVGGGKKKQTKTVTNTSNPEWFYTADFPIDMVKGPVLKIQVFDCDGKGKKFRSDQIFLFTR
jgi:Ca2+-dependent lipid-binding protein